MTKNKVIAVGLSLLGILFGAAVQQGLIPVPKEMCPPSAPAAPMLDAGTQ